MQKLVWQNAKGDELNLTKDPFGITQWEGFSNTGLNIQSQTVPFADGSVFLDALMEQRELSVTLAINDENDLYARYELKRQLISALNPKLGEGYLIYTNDYTSKRIKCVAQLPIFPTKNSNDVGTQKASLSWVACEPYWEDLEETIVDFEQRKKMIVTDEGDVDSEPTLTIFSKNNEQIRLENKTNGTGLTIEGNIEAAIKINLETGVKTAKTEKLNTDLYFIDFSFVLTVDKYIYGFKNFSGITSVYKSADGIKFEQISSFLGYAPLGIAYLSENGFCIIATNYIYTSNDMGKTWNIFSNENSLKKISCGDDSDRYFATNYTKIYTSQNGYTWSEAGSGYSYVSKLPAPFKSEINGVVFDFYFIDKNENKLYGYSVAQSSAALIYSGDEEIDDFTRFRDLLVLVCGGQPYYSTDGTTWDVGDFTTFSNGIKLLSTEQILYGCRYGVTIFFSYDGKLWQEKTLRIQADFWATAISYNNNLYIFGYDEWYNEYDEIYASKINITSICEKNGKYIALVGTDIYQSSDLKEWEFVRTLGENITWLKNVNQIIFAGSTDGKLYFSHDGITWESKQVMSSLAVNKELFDICYESGEYYIAADSAIYKSSDLDNFNILFNVAGNFYKIFPCGNNLVFFRVYNNSYIVGVMERATGNMLYTMSNNDIINGDYDYDNDLLLMEIGGIIYYARGLKEARPTYPVSAQLQVEENIPIQFWKANSVFTGYGKDKVYVFISPYENISISDYSVWGDIFIIDDKILTINSGNLRESYLVENENIIKNIRECDFVLSKGENLIKNIVRKNNINLLMEFRQKYIGV